MISIVMSVYNEEEGWIRESIESILCQTYKNFELIIIIDNPSMPKDTRKYIEDKKEQDSRIVVLYNETNLGLALSLNRGIAVAKGEYIARMDADDISMPDRLERELSYLKKTGVDMVSTNAIVIDEKSNIVRNGIPLPENPMNDLIYTNVIIHPSVLIRSKAICDVGGYRNFKRSQDYDLWLRMMTAGYQIRTIDAYLMKYRVRTSSITKEGRLEQYYINLYQKRLYKERIRTGHDSFSEDGVKKYLASKHINEKKNQRCIKCMNNLDEAKRLIVQKNARFVLYYLSAFLVFPSIALYSIVNYVCKNVAK